MELRLWEQVLAIEPVGGDRGDFQAALVAHAVDQVAYVTALSHGAKRAKEPKMADRIVDWWKSAKTGKAAKVQTAYEKAAGLLASLGVLRQVTGRKQRRPAGKTTAHRAVAHEVGDRHG